MKQLNTLRLGLHHWGGSGAENEKGNFEFLHIDISLLDPETANSQYFFPDSKSLELFDCTLRMSGLLSGTETHQ